MMEAELTDQLITKITDLFKMKANERKFSLIFFSVLCGNFVCLLDSVDGRRAN
jgi:hypothetical protein